MLIPIILSFCMVLPGYFILDVLKFKTGNICEQLAFAYILSLAAMFSLLYLGSFSNAFDVAALTFLVLSAISFVFLAIQFGLRAIRSYKHSFPFQIKISKMKLTIAISVMILVVVYLIFFNSRAILDSDVVHEYLPIAREIVKENKISYGNGYDYNVLLKPIGVSMIYAWSYVISGSIFSESFRLLPIIPIIMLIVLNYSIATSSTKSKTIGLLSTAMFLIFPFNDRFLLFNGLYPDIFYYPLIFAVSLFLLKYLQLKKNSYLFFSGIALGVASLLKAQFIYFFIAFILVLVVVKFRHFVKVSTMISILTPFYLLLPNILSESIQGGSFHLALPSMTEVQIILLFFFSALSGICYRIFLAQNKSKEKFNWPKISSFIKVILTFSVPFIFLFSLWYAINFFNFGTIIWTSSASLPNYNWALELLEPVTNTVPAVGLWYYLVNFIFTVIDPAVMGFVFLVPLLMGLVIVLKNRNDHMGLNILVIFTVFSTFLMFSRVILSINSGGLSYNPRDIFLFVPLLTILCSLGIVNLPLKGIEASIRGKFSLCSFLWVVYFGLLSFVQSVYVLFIERFSVTTIGGLTSIISGIFGLTLTQTSLSLSQGERLIFIGEDILTIVSFSLIIGFPLLNRDLLNRMSKIIRKSSIKDRIQFSSFKISNLLKSLFFGILLFSVIVFPRTEMLLVQGGIKNLESNQLEMYYGELYGLISNQESLEGDVLTFNAPKGLPYYLSNTKIIDMRYPANLAYLKDYLTLSTINQTVSTLNELGIKHVLINPSLSGSSLNLPIFNILGDPEWSILSQSYGNWKLYTIRPINVEKNFLPINNWMIDNVNTNGTYILETNDELFLQLNATTLQNKVTLVNKEMPQLNLSKYDFARVKLEGTKNARILIRFYFIDGRYVDFSYWNSVFQVSNSLLDLSLYPSTLRGDAYIGLKSSDALSAEINVQEISFIKIVE